MENHRVGRWRRSQILQSVLLWPALVLATSLAAAAEPPVDLSLEQALSEALERNPSLAVERRDIEIAAGALRQAGTYEFNPELEVERDVGQARGPETQSIGLSQTVWLRGQRSLRVRSAEAGLLGAQSTFQDAERQIVADTMNVYGELLVSQWRKELAQEDLGVVSQLRDAAQKLLEADEVPQLDVLRADVEVRKAENRLVAQERSVANAQRELALLIGRPVDTPIRAAAPTPVLPVPKGKLAASGQEVFERRPDLTAALTAVEARKAEIGLVNAERFFPELKIGLKYEESREFNTMNQRYLLTLSFPLPLFNRRDGELDSALAELAKQEAQVALARRRIEKEVSTSISQVLASRRIVDEYVQRILPQQEKNFTLLREAYTFGQIRITDVLLGQREFIESREAYLDAVGTLNAATAELYRVLNARL